MSSASRLQCDAWIQVVTQCSVSIQNISWTTAFISSYGWFVMYQNASINATRSLFDSKRFTLSLKFYSQKP